jgi:hypothetical protein
MPRTVTVLYITSTRLMRESEDAVREHAGSGDDVWRRVCSQLIASRPRYAEWHASHEMKMGKVARARIRGPQVGALRTVAVQQIHRTALVNYLRLGRVTGPASDNALRLFHGVSDLRDATLAEHVATWSPRRPKSALTTCSSSSATPKA